MQSVVPADSVMLSYLHGKSLEKVNLPVLGCCSAVSLDRRKKPSLLRLLSVCNNSYVLSDLWLRQQLLGGEAAAAKV